MIRLEHLVLSCTSLLPKIVFVLVLVFYLLLNSYIAT